MVSALSAQEGHINNCKERYVALESHIVQRLRWAAGANPMLNTVLQNFEEASFTHQKMIEVRVLFVCCCFWFCLFLLLLLLFFYCMQ
jgi:PI-3-kinase-related kinase SMG-1